MFSNVKMLLEEILPSYFLVMLVVIMFTSHVPTMFELYIVYAFAFGVALFNNILDRENTELHSWGKKAIDLMQRIEAENEDLHAENKSLNEKLELISNESIRISIGDSDDNDVLEKHQEHIQVAKETRR